jgi:hypothetical protein
MSLTEIKLSLIKYKKTQKLIQNCGVGFVLLSFVSLGLGSFIGINDWSDSWASLLCILPLAFAPFTVSNLLNEHEPIEKLNNLNQKENFSVLLNLSLSFLLFEIKKLNDDKTKEYETIKDLIAYNQAFNQKDNLPNKIEQNMKNNEMIIKKYFSAKIKNIYENIHNSQFNEIINLDIKEKENVLKNYFSDMEYKKKEDEKRAHELEKSLGFSNKAEEKTLSLKL